MLVVTGASPYRTLADLIAAARAKPGELSLASGGPASSLHFAFEVLKRAANINMTYVPYGGTAPAINALVGGHVTAVFADYPTVVSQLKSGNLRGLVTASQTRVEPLPDVPTLAETGISKYEADIFYGIVAPAKTPAEMVSQLAGRFTAAMQAPEMKPKLDQQGLFPAVRCGADFGALHSPAGRRIQPRRPRDEHQDGIAGPARSAETAGRTKRPGRTSAVPLSAKADDPARCRHPIGIM